MTIVLAPPHLDWCITGVQRYQLIISLFMLLLLLLTSGKSCQSCQKQRAGDEMAKASKALKAVKSWEKLVSITELKPSMLGLVLPFVLFSLDVDAKEWNCTVCNFRTPTVSWTGWPLSFYEISGTCVQGPGYCRWESLKDNSLRKLFFFFGLFSYL